MRTGRVLTLAGLGLALVVAGCSEPDVGAARTPLATPTAGSVGPTTPSASPTPPPPSTTTPPTAPSSIPAAARAHTNAGAEAFAIFYVSQINAAWTLPSVGLLMPLSSKSCKTCQNLEAASTRLQAQHHRYDKEPITVQSSVVVRGNNTSVQVELRVVQEARSILDLSGAVVRVTTEQQGIFQIDPTWLPGSGWRVSKFFIQSAPS